MGNVTLKRCAPLVVVRLCLEHLERGEHTVFVHTALQAMDSLEVRLDEMGTKLSDERYPEGVKVWAAQELLEQITGKARP